MGEPGQRDEKPTGADGAATGNPAIPASEEGTGIVPGDEGDPAADTHKPASEEDSGLIESEDEAPAQSWPGSGGPGTIPPPG